MKNAPRIALIDIENAPNTSYTWGKWEQNVIEFEEHWYILSFSVKWLDKKKITTHALPDFQGYEKHKNNDKALVKELWKVFDEADIIIAHNGDRFDIKKANARFAAYDFKPPSPYKSIDTLKVARKHFKFESNKLDDLGQYLNVGRKLPHTGKHLWLGCMRGDEKSWRTMRRYNAQDVALLERVYLRLRPWMTTHPNLNSYTKRITCPKCQSPHVQQRGWNVTATGKRARIHCQSCGGWSSGLKHIRNEPRRERTAHC